MQIFHTTFHTRQRVYKNRKTDIPYKSQIQDLSLNNRFKAMRFVFLLWRTVYACVFSYTAEGIKKSKCRYTHTTFHTRQRAYKNRNTDIPYKSQIEDLSLNNRFKAMRFVFLLWLDLL